MNNKIREIINESLNNIKRRKIPSVVAALDLHPLVRCAWFDFQLGKYIVHAELFSFCFQLIGGKIENLNLLKKGQP